MKKLLLLLLFIPLVSFGQEITDIFPGKSLPVLIIFLVFIFGLLGSFLIKKLPPLLQKILNGLVWAILILFFLAVIWDIISHQSA